MSERKNHTAWLMLYWVIAAACISTRLYLDHLLTFDTWWHLAMGGQILRDWQIPPPEIFSFTAPGVSTHYHSWLSGVLFELIHRNLGLGALECLAALAVMATAVMCAEIAAALGSTALLACFAIPAFFVFAGPFLIIRPHLFTFLLFAALFKGYLSKERGGELSVIYTIVLFGLWANLHGGFLLGLVFLAGLTALEYGGLKLYGREFFRAPSSAFLLLMGGVLGSFLHPQGIGQVTNVLLHDPLAQGVHLHINEWLPPSEEMIYAVAACAVAGLLLAFRSREIFPAIILAAFSAPAIFIWRHLPLFGIAGVPALLALLSAALPFGQKEFKLPKNAAALFGAALAAALLFLGTRAFKSEGEILSTGWAQREFPVRAAEFLSKNRDGKRIFNPFEWGGYLLYRLSPDYQVYIDSRVIPYSGIYPEEFFTIWELKPGWNEALQFRAVDLVVVQPSSRIWGALSASPEWEIVYQDEISGILRKKG